MHEINKTSNNETSQHYLKCFVETCVCTPIPTGTYGLADIFIYVSWIITKLWHKLLCEVDINERMDTNAQSHSQFLISKGGIARGRNNSLVLRNPLHVSMILQMAAWLYFFKGKRSVTTVLNRRLSTNI